MRNVVCEFLNERSVTLSVPAAAEVIYVCRDPASGEGKLVTWDVNEVARWQNASVRCAPWVEVLEIAPSIGEDDEQAGVAAS